MGPALVLHCWAVIGLCWAAVMVSSHYLGWFWPLTLLITTPIIGGRQLGLGILQHDAAHGALHPDPKVGDWISDVLCLSGVERYRKYHLQHHKFAQQAEDPDLGLSAPFPITPTSLRRKVVRDLTGQTWFKQRFGDFGKKLKARKAGEPAAPIVWAEIVKQRRWLLNGGDPGDLCWLLGPVPALLLRATWQMMITRFRNIAEHALVGKNEPDPLRHARRPTRTARTRPDRALLGTITASTMSACAPAGGCRMQRLLREKGFSRRHADRAGLLTC